MYRPLPDGLTIKNSPIEGLGLFTNVDIGLHTVTVRDKNGCGEVSDTVAVIGYKKFFSLMVMDIMILGRLAI